MSDTSPSSPGQSKSPARKPMAVPGVWSRLRIYLIGIGIGLVLLGSFHVMKRMAQEREEFAAKAVGPFPGTPPKP